jgi:hypothetical protein
MAPRIGQVDFDGLDLGEHPEGYGQPCAVCHGQPTAFRVRGWERRQGPAGGTASVALAGGTATRCLCQRHGAEARRTAEEFGWRP